MTRRDFPEFSQDCEAMIEGLRCLKEKMATPKGRFLLEDLEDQIMETRVMARRLQPIS